MRGGLLQQRVEIQSVTSAQDDAGEVTRTFRTLWQPWAQVLTPGGGESVDQQRMQRYGELTHLVKIRYRAGVTRNQRVLWDGRTLEILAVADEENNATWLHLYCKEIA
jgi:SPP1 family predicted phage head-tail adaptor